MNEKFLTEKIAFYKFWMAFMITADVSLMTWGYNHLKNLSVFNFIFMGSIVLFLTLTILIINKKSRMFLEKLEDINGN